MRPHWPITAVQWPVDNNCTFLILCNHTAIRLNSALPGHMESDVHVNREQRYLSFKLRIAILYGQQSCIKGLFLACVEHARITDIEDISREVTEAADRSWASGARILDYIPKDRPLSNHIYAFTVASMRL
eukprot:4490643-Heterocapsa_arctica.AAC.1